MRYNPERAKKSRKRAQLWIFTAHFFKFRAFIALHPRKQQVFLEFLVENKAFYSTKRALRADTARSKWLKWALILQINIATNWQNFLFVKIWQNTGQRNPYSPIFYALLETMIGAINPNTYMHWLNEKILPEVYSEPNQTSEMELFVKIRSRHSELFLKIGVTKE